MKYFLYKLISPRTTFWNDMTNEEMNIMREHGAYWRGLFASGTAHAFGPVLDPKGAWGVAIFEAEDDAAAHSLCENDPAIRSNAGFQMEILPMAQATVRK